MANAGPKPSDRDGETLNLYRLLPLAEPNDPRWDMATFQGEVLVRARSPADARLVAAEAETDFRDVPALPGDGNSTDMASAFRDDKLYTVREADEPDVPRRGKREIVSGTVRRHVIASIVSRASMASRRGEGEL